MEQTTLYTLDKVLPAAGITNNTALSIRRIQPWTMVGNIITVSQSLTINTYLQIQMRDTTIEDNYGEYSYTRLTDVIDNFLIAYVGAGKAYT